MFFFGSRSLFFSVRKQALFSVDTHPRSHTQANYNEIFNKDYNSSSYPRPPTGEGVTPFLNSGGWISFLEPAYRCFHHIVELCEALNRQRGDQEVANRMYAARGCITLDYTSDIFNSLHGVLGAFEQRPIEEAIDWARSTLRNPKLATQYAQFSHVKNTKEKKPAPSPFFSTTNKTLPKYLRYENCAVPHMNNWER